MSPRVSFRYRLGVAMRIAAAALGGYALAAAMAFGLARALPASRSEAVIGATILAMLAMPAAAVWAFAVRSAWRAWAGIGVVTLAFAALGWWIGQPG